MRSSSVFCLIILASLCIAEEVVIPVDLNSVALDGDEATVKIPVSEFPDARALSDDDDLATVIDKDVSDIKRYLKTHSTSQWNPELVEPAFTKLAESGEPEELIAGLRSKFRVRIEREEKKKQRKLEREQRQAEREAETEALRRSRHEEL